jgi:hypothetical protein
MRRLCLAALALGMMAAPARAERGAFGAGIIVGRPTGITGEYELSDSTAIDMAIGLDLFGGRHFYVHADFLFILPDLLGGGSVGLSPYLGPGVYLADVGGNDRLGLGLHAPFGLSLDFTRAPLQLFAELSLDMSLVPDVDVGVAGAGGFRYYF